MGGCPASSLCPRLCVIWASSRCPSTPQLVGLHTDRLKLKTAAISLDGLLDYNQSDR